MRIRLYVDEDTMDDELMEALRTHNIDAISVRDVSRQGHSDEQQLLYATEQGRVLYGFNVKDYVVLHSRFLEQGLSHAGILLAHKHRYSIGEQMRRIVRLAETLSVEEMQNRLEYLGSWG